MSKVLSINERLKRCPFCGGEARVATDFGISWIECRECEAKSTQVKNSPYIASAEVASEKWNARIDQKQASSFDEGIRNKKE